LDDSTPIIIWIVGLSGLTVVAVVALLLGAMLLHQRRLVRQAAQWGRHLLESLDSERNRIAAELHDDMVPQLITVRRTAEQRGDVGEFARLSEIIADLRGLAHDLHPPALRHLDLGRALSDLADDQREASGPAVSVRIEAGVPNLDSHRNLTLYRIAQEAVVNATRHADATTVEISLAASHGAVILAIRDDGTGVADPSVLGMGFGTRSMRERASSVGGRLDFESAVGRGTVVTCRVPTP
jgi:signal transduction histidine kinase